MPPCSRAPGEISGKMTDRVFATAPPGKAYVFRHNFSGSKWENVTNKKDGTSSVTFRKRGDKFFIRIAPEGGEKKVS